MDDELQLQRHTPVYRSLNYTWTMGGLSAGEWLAASAPGFVYFALAQLSSAFAGEVPLPAYAAVALVAWGSTAALQAAVGLCWPAFAGPSMGGLVCALGWGALWTLDHGDAGLPLWPTLPVAAGAMSFVFVLQWGQPPGALGRSLQGLWHARPYSAALADLRGRALPRFGPRP